jgi:hypothetical protein
MTARATENEEDRVGRTTGDQLGDLLQRQVEAVGNETISSGGQVSADQVEALGRLARIVEIHRAAQPAVVRKRWPAAVLFGSTLLIASILLFAHVRDTEIELDLIVSEVSFISPTQQTLAETMQLSTLGVSGLQEIQLPGTPNEGAETHGSPDGGESGVRLSVNSVQQRRGSINLATVVLTKENHVWLRYTGPPRQYRMSLKGSPSEFRADVLGPVQVGFFDGGVQQLDFEAPQSVLMQSGTEDTDFDLSFDGPIGSTFSPQLSANALSLLQIEEFLDPEKTVVRHISSVQSGSLYFVSIGDQERKLRPGELISFEESQGEFRTLVLRDDHIELKYHGRVRGMNVGLDENRRSIMPTLLEWLSARHSLSLLWGTAIYLFGLIAAAFRWFGRST